MLAIDTRSSASVWHIRAESGCDHAHERRPGHTRVEVSEHLHRAATDIGLDLVPELTPGTATCDSETCDSEAGSALAALEQHAHGVRHAFERRQHHMAGFGRRGQAQEDASGVRVPVGRPLTCQMRQEHQPLRIASCCLGQAQRLRHGQADQPRDPLER